MEGSRHLPPDILPRYREPPMGDVNGAPGQPTAAFVVGKEEYLCVSRCGEEWCGCVRCCVLCCGVVWHAVVLRCVVLCDVVWCCVVW